MQTHATGKSNTNTTDLHHVLHATFDLYRATHMAHWNIRGPYFPQLHTLFEGQYNELWLALDTLAERIRAVGGDVDPNALAGSAPAAGHEANATISQLAKTHRKMATHLKELEAAATKSGDAGTADLFIQRIQAHDKAAWMLESTLQGM